MTIGTSTITSDINTSVIDFGLNTSTIHDITSSNYFLLQIGDLLIIEDDSGFIVLN